VIKYPGITQTHFYFCVNLISDHSLQTNRHGVAIVTAVLYLEGPRFDP